MPNIGLHLTNLHCELPSTGYIRTKSLYNSDLNVISQQDNFLKPHNASTVRLLVVFTSVKRISSFIILRSLVGILCKLKTINVVDPSCF